MFGKQTARSAASSRPWKDFVQILETVESQLLPALKTRTISKGLNEQEV
jgi:hypothetical protein